MWIKNRINSDSLDSKIVVSDYILFNGTTKFSFCDEKDKENIFGVSFKTPIFQIIKVHRNYPLRVTSAGTNHVRVYPYKKDKRMPAEVYSDKKSYDCVSFALIPFQIETRAIEKGGASLSKIEKSFVKTIKDKQEYLEFSDSYLYYIAHGLEVESETCARYCFVIPSQVVNHLFSWLSMVHQISSLGLQNQEILGKIKIPLENARELTFEFSKKLEERYRSRIMFDDYKKAFENKGKK